MNFKFLKSIDIFSKKMILNINKQETVSTWEGIVLSITLYTLSIIILVFNFYQNYQEINPIVERLDKYRTEYKQITVPNSSIDLAFGMYYTNITTFEIQLLRPNNLNLIGYDAEFKTREVGIDKNGLVFLKNNTIGYLNDCKKRHNEKNILTQNTICYNFNKSINQTFGGNLLLNKNDIFLSTNFHYPLYKAYNILNNYTEKELSEIKKNEYVNEQLLNEPSSVLTLGFIYSTQIIDIYKYNGVKTYDVNYYVSMDYRNQYLKIIYIYHKKEIKTDRSKLYFFGKEDTNTIYEREVKFEVQSKPDFYKKNEVVFEIDGRVSNVETIFKRSYNKIDSILAFSISMIDVIMFFFQIISGYLSSNSSHYALINHLFYENLEHRSSFKNYYVDRELKQNETKAKNRILL